RRFVMAEVSRRDILRLGGAVGAAGLLAGSPMGRLAAQPGTAATPARVIPEGVGSRGYYLTFGRIPTVSLPTWRRIMDSFAEDGIDHVILYLTGAFKSRKYPITWKYNENHANVRDDFVGELIDYAHTKDIKV